MLQSFSNVRDPFIVFDSLVTVDQGNQDIGEQASDIKSNQTQDEVVLLLGDKQGLASLLISVIAADHMAFLLIRVGVARYEGLLLVALLVHGGSCCEYRRTRLRNT